jgi:hypothetical protein
MIGSDLGLDIGGVSLVDDLPLVPYRTLVIWPGIPVSPTEAEEAELDFLEEWAD